ncbi:MAG: M56 family metallopeptidase [Phycisphaerae bacterium]|nr:M56 family metallopeptidase [Phycisphaerae bacterium]
MTPLEVILAGMWRSAWGILPVALLALLTTRWLAARPATRHWVWVSVLGWMVVGGFLPAYRGPAPIAPPLATIAPAPGCAAVSPNELLADPVSAETEPVFAIRQPEPAFATPDAIEPADWTPTPTGDLNEPSLALSEIELPAESVALNDGPLLEDLVDLALADESLLGTIVPAATDELALAQDSPAMTVDDDEAAPAADQPAAASRTAERMLASLETARVHWHTAVSAVRAAVESLPSPPAWIWLIGGALFAIWISLQSIAAQARARADRPAPKDVQRCVAAIARKLRVTPPETVMSERSVSPHIWCALRPKLVLPRRLWADLDRDGRHAVVCHELAHLSRCDHWVRRFELAATALFWWHPILWWVRHRIAEEADLSCDAWVTWLAPRKRRAYAEALLRAQSACESSTEHPSLAVGLLTKRSRKLARRLTMVMTQSNRPQASLLAGVWASMLLLAGWVTLPAWACPPEAKNAHSHAASPAHMAGHGHATPAVAPNGCVNVAGAKVSGALAPVTASASATTNEDDEDDADAPTAQTYVRYMKDGVPTPVAVNLRMARPGEAPVAIIARADSDAAQAAAEAHSAAAEAQAEAEDQTRENEAQMRELEAELRALEAQLRDLERAMRDRSPGAGNPPPPPGVMRRSPMPPVPPMPAMPPAAASPRMAPMAPMAPIAPAAPAPRMRRAQRSSGGESHREYCLPSGKCETLMELLVREDVPVRVSRNGDCISVNASEQQHAAIGAFVEMIRGSWENKSYKLPAEKMEAFYALMSRNDVPIKVSGGGDTISAEATQAQHEILAAFLEAIHPGSNPGALERLGRNKQAKRGDGLGAGFGGAFGMTSPMRVGRRWPAGAGQSARELEQLARDLHGAERQRARELEMKARQLQNAARDRHRAAEQRRNQVERRREQIEQRRQQIQERRDQIRERSQALPESEEPQRAALEQQDLTLEAQLEALEAEMEAFEGQIESEASAMEHDGEMTEAAAEWLAKLQERQHTHVERLNEAVRALTEAAGVSTGDAREALEKALLEVEVNMPDVSALVDEVTAEAAGESADVADIVKEHLATVSDGALRTVHEKLHAAFEALHDGAGIREHLAAVVAGQAAKVAGDAQAAEKQAAEAARDAAKKAERERETAEPKEETAP